MSGYTPNRIANRLLHWLCKDDLLEEIEGDLYEHYLRLRSDHSKLYAGISYWYHVINFLRPFALKKIGQNSNTIIMYRSYFKFAIRNMWRQKLSTIYNLTGLILAFTVSGLIYLHLKHELSYEDFYQDSEDIYRVAWMNNNPQTRTPHPMAQQMVADMPEVEAAVSLSPIYGPGLTRISITMTMEENNISFDEYNGFFADSTFFDVFHYDFIEGNPDEAMTIMNGVVISQSMAQRYFGGEAALGKRLSFGPSTDMLEVVGVIPDTPKNSHFHVNFLISYVTLKSLSFNDPWMSWDDFGHFNYIKLVSGAKSETVSAKIPDWVTNFLNWSEEGLEGIRNGEDRFALQPIQDIHLHSNIRWELETNSSTTYLVIYGVSGLFILLISVINFINLSTAQSARRVKEVGVKKTLGAKRKELFTQFIFESLLISYVSLAASIFLILNMEPAFNALVSGQIETNDILNTQAIGFMVLVTTITAFVAAIYPSLYLNRLMPGDILKGIAGRKIGGANIRNSLLGVQLIASVVMISGSLIIKSQIEFLRNKDLGFNKENLVTIEMDNFIDRSDVIKSEFASIASVNGTSTLSNVPGGQFNQHPLYAEKNPDQRIDASEIFVDKESMEVLGLRLKEGRMLDKVFASDSAGTSFILNETAVRELGTDIKVGENIVWVDNENLVTGKLVGIVHDFHYRSLHVPIRPVIMMIRPQSYNYILAKLDGNNLSQTIGEMEKAYAKVFPEADFKLSFLDQKIESLYNEESRTLLLTSILSGISIFLAVAGLIGIVLIAIKQRVKEIGIRKVLGASLTQILWLINFRYMAITLIAIVVAVPAAYALMSNWLNNFTYQNNINPLIFGFTGVGVLILIFATISAISLRTAKGNPASALRSE